MKPSASARQTFPALAAAILLAGCGEDPRGLITEMGRAYRGAASYADDARVVVRQTSGALSTDAAFPFRVAFSRPDRIRIDAYDARIAADGTRLFAAVGGVPGTGAAWAAGGVRRGPVALGTARRGLRLWQRLR